MDAPGHFFMDKKELSAWSDIVKFGTEIIERLSEVSGLEESSDLLGNFAVLVAYEDNLEGIKNCEVFKPEKIGVHPLPEESQKRLLLDPLGTVAATPTISETGVPPHMMELLPSQEDCQEIVTFLNSKFLDRNNACLLYTSPSPRDLSTSRMPSSA